LTKAKVKVKVPKQVKFASITYSLYLDKNLEKDGDWGHHKGRKQELLVNPIMTDEQRVVTLLHEAIHSSKTVWGTHLTEGDTDRVANCMAVLLDALGVELDWSEVPVRELEL
jgi:hypothetical protein